MKRLFLTSFSFLILSSFFSSCNNGSDQNTGVFKEEIENRKPKRIKPFQIIDEGYKKGREVVKALELTDTAARSIDSLQEIYVADINNVDLHHGFPANLQKVESEIYQAYQYNLANGLSLSENIQMEDTFLLYTAPVSSDTSKIWSIKFSKRFLIMNME